jgi:TM2 domain-containing membrane protein YozV
MTPQKVSRQTTPPSNWGWVVFGSLLIGAGILCLLFAWSGLQIYMAFLTGMESEHDGFGALGTIFLFSTAGVSSLAMALGLGILGLILLIIGVATWSIGYKRYYAR